MGIQIRTGALAGIDGLAVTVETDLSRGLPGFHLVGLPGTEVRESRDRVLAALRHCGIRIPPAKITVNLAPAGVRKVGASYDVAIAMSVVCSLADREPDAAAERRRSTLFLGELSLFGELRPVRGLLSIVLDAAARGDGRVVVPAEQAWEASLVTGMEVVPAAGLDQIVRWWRTGEAPCDTSGARTPPPVDRGGGRRSERALDALAGLRGQALARKAAVVAAAGRHNLLLVGPPGSGKTRLARMLGELQPGLEADEALEVTRIQSAAGVLSEPRLATRRPFRAPHHTITRAGLVGGGPGLLPGEATLAHGGMLFLDELAEFSPAVLDALREPLEDGVLTLVRNTGARRYPAAFQLVAAMNPCRCGYLGSCSRACSCTPGERTRYRARLSGPLLDRFDLFVEVGDWRGRFLDPGEPPAAGADGGVDWRNRPTASDLERTRQRLCGRRGATAALRDRLDPAALELLESARRPLGLSLRGVQRILRVAATIAALDDRERIGEGQVREALEFRNRPETKEPA